MPSHDTRRWRSNPHLRVSIERLHAIFDYLDRHDIHMYRMASDVVPYGGAAAHDVDVPGADGGLDPVPLAAAIAAALARPAPRPADRAWRDQQLAAVRAVHAQVYASVVGDRLRT